MVKMRFHLLVVLIIFLGAFMLGSAFDLNVATTLFSKNNGFGLFCSAIGTLPGYMVLAVIGGGAFSLAFRNKEYKTVYKVLLYLLSLIGFGAAIFFSGREFFSSNSFDIPKLKWLGFLIAVPFAAGSGYLGHLIVKNSTTPYSWLIMCVMAIAIFLALVPGVTLLKEIFHRPRFRTVIEYDAISFHSWWERCTNYKDLMAEFSLLKEEFKSFPSGHAGASAVVMLAGVALPLFNKKYLKLQLPIFYAGFVWCVFISFTRMLVGAHYLSDVSMGALLTVVFSLIMNEVLIALNSKYYFIKE